MPMVKNTCTCTTSDARPGEMKRVMAMNSSPNCATPISSPYAARLRQLAAGRRMNSSAGNAASAKRSVASASGGKCASAYLMTTKLVPHTATTASPSSMWDRGSAPDGGLGREAFM